MAVETTTQLFDAFLGNQEGIHSAILPDLFSSGGSKNVYIDKFARVTKIPGYAKANNSAITTNVGGTACSFRGLFPYKITSGGTVTRILVGIIDDAVDEWELWTSADSGASWTFRNDAGATPVGQNPDFAQFGDDLFITTGKTVPKRLNNTTVTTAGGTQSPQPSVSATGTGYLNGNYRYKLLSVVGETKQIGSLASSNTAISNAQGSLTWTIDSNASVTGYELYRTTGTGTVYYLVAYIDARATAAYTDNVPDEEILANRVLQEHGDAPPTCYFVEPHKQRMWWGRTDTNQTRVYWSDPGDADSVYAFNYLDFSDTDTQGDVVTGMVGGFGGLLVVFTEKAIWTVSGTGALIGNITDWTRSRSNAQTGTVTTRSAVRVPSGARYTDQSGDTQIVQSNQIAYFTPQGDIRLFDGLNDIVISHPVKTTLAGLNYSARQKVWALHDTTNQQVIWFYPSSAATECDKAVAWSYRYGVWYPWTTMPFAHGCEQDSSASAPTMITGSSSKTTGGYAYTFFSGNSFDGAAIPAAWMTKTLRGKRDDGRDVPELTKRWRWVDLVFKISNTVAVTVEWMPGWATDDAIGIGSKIVQPDAGTLVTSDGLTIVTAGGDTVTVSVESSQGTVLLHSASGKYLHDTGLRLRFSDNAALGSWSLETFTLGYQILPGGGRGLQ